MRLRVIAISLLLIAVIAANCNAQQTNYSGTAKLVLRLEKIPDMPAMPDNPAKTGGLVPTTFGFPAIVQDGSTSAFNSDSYGEFATPQAPPAPPVPQGTMLDVTVLYSSDPAFKVNDSCLLTLDYDAQNMPYGLQSQLLDNLNPGTILGVNDYTVNGNNIKVDVSTSNWQGKIFIVNAQATTSPSKNPFRIDLNFKQFNDFAPFPSTTPINVGPAWPSWNTSVQSPGSLSNLGFLNIVSHFLG